MTSDVVLTAALRNNLLSLQNTQSAIDKTQLRLATGNKVNSALDNPSSFFAAQSLNNRASDLTRLLDGIGQSIQVIKAADNGVTALTSLVEQAESIANSAQDALSQGTAEAKITGNVDLSGVDDLTTINGIANGDDLIITLTDDNGDPINIGRYGGAAAATVTIDIATNESVEDLIAEINDINFQIDGAGNAVGDQALEASLDESGNLQIRSLEGGNFNVQFASAAGGDGPDLAFAQALGFGNIARLANDGTGAANNNVEVSAIADVALRSFDLTRTVAGSEETALRSTLLSALNEQSTGAVQAVFNGTLGAAGDDFTISINGGTAQTIDLTDASNNAVTLQSFIDQINQNSTLNQYIEAEFNDDTGVLSIRSISAETETIQIGATNGADANLGFGVAGLSGAGSTDVENIALASAAADLAQFETDFDRVRSQITELVTNGDTGYRGTNLLNGDDLLTVFNEFRSSSLTTSGVTFTADGLGINDANFSTQETVTSALTEIRSALEAVRSFGSSLANDLTVIQTRETFTQNTVNTLTEGADKLTIADQNEEGAKLLALQTRQQLGVTSLSLASQSQQSILRLF